MIPPEPPSSNRARAHAIREALTSPVPALSHEDRAAFDQFCEGIRESFRPVGALETDLAQAIAEDRWRLNRARTIESAIFALGQRRESAKVQSARPELRTALLNGLTWLADGRSLQFLTAYEQSVQRSCEKYMVQLSALQAVRRAARQRIFDEVRLLSQLAAVKSETYDPTPDLQALDPEYSDIAFPHSIAEAARRTRRQQRLEEARHYAANGWDASKPYRRATPEAA